MQDQKKRLSQKPLFYLVTTDCYSFEVFHFKLAINFGKEVLNGLIRIFNKFLLK